MSNEIFKCYFCHKDFTGMDARVHFENYVHDQEQAIQERVRRESLTMHEVWSREQTAKIEELTLLAGEIPDLKDNRDYWRSKAIKLQVSLDAIPSTPTPAKEPSGELEKAVEARVFEICLKAVEDEKEFPGEPPSGFFDSIKNIPEVEKARIIVALTKSGIRTRIKALANFSAQVTKEGM